MDLKELLEKLKSLDLPDDTDVRHESREFCGPLDVEGCPVDHEIYRIRVEEVREKRKSVSEIILSG